MSLYCPVIIASYAVCAGMTEQKELVDGQMFWLVVNAQVSVSGGEASYLNGHNIKTMSPGL